MSDTIQLYDKSSSDTINRLSRCLWPRVIEFIDNIQPEDIFIDFGCGAGRYAEYVMNKLCPHIYCIDASEQMLDVTKTCTPIANVVKFDMRNGDYSQIANYSIGICIAVISHFTDTNERIYAIFGMLSKLNPGGKLLIVVWDFAKVHPSKFVNNDKSQPGDYHIILDEQTWFYHLYSLESFKDFMTNLIDLKIYKVEFSTSKYNIYCEIYKIVDATSM